MPIIRGMIPISSQLAARANATAKFSSLRPLLNFAKRVVKAVHPYLPAVLFRTMPKIVIPQALAYALAGESLAPESPTRARRVRRIVELLRASRSLHSSCTAWGLPFTWRDTEIYPPHWPVAFSSTVVGHSLLDAIALLPPALVDEWIRGLMLFVDKECRVVRTPSGPCYRLVKGSDSPIIFCSMIG